ncbi:MAG TPA: histone deacetylase [Candidatus Methylomirabilis sp.]|jgi:acetoin utilization deacetylase AcuC-like enzyme|nr:histone deacetylase [Candidatus Methylomirabilis sp.]
MILYACASPAYTVTLPERHPFPMAKYRLVRERLLSEGALSPRRLIQPAQVPVELLGLVHTQEYLDRLLTGRLTRQEEVRTGFPWSPAIVARARHAAQGTLMAARIALREGLAANLAGGSHHAFPDHGEGYCLLNDVAVAIRVLQAEGRIRRAAILDTDAHQGNGTAAAFAGDPTIFTFSIHGARNYPFQKVPGSWDEPLPDGTSDEAYLERLDGPLRAAAAFAPDLAFYVSGADPYRGDRLGRLGLSRDGLARRDHLVTSGCVRAGIPVVVTLAGGYAATLDETVEIHCTTVRTGARLFKDT